MDYKGMAWLRSKLSLKRTRVLLRYKYYEMKDMPKDLGISSPPELRFWMSALGWCAKSVNALADRLVFRNFRNDLYNMNRVYELNNPDILMRSAMLSALIASCSFIYISPDENGFPRLQVIGAKNATGRIDAITGLLKEGYAVLEREAENGRPILEAYFTCESTEYYRDGRLERTVKNVTGHPLLVPIIFQPDEERPFGHSRISRACMDLQGAAIRTIKRSEIAAEFYSFPQKYATGLDPDLEKMDKWKATMTTMLTFTKDEDGDKPTLGQFQQASMTPHMEMLRMFAAAFCGETGLTLDDLGFASENPMSSEAIRATHESLLLTARSAQRSFGSGFLNAGYLAACLRDEYPYRREQMTNTMPIWEPVFEHDMNSLSGIGDAVQKIQSAFPDYFTEEKLRDLTGI